MNLEQNSIHIGDNLDLLKSIENNSIHLHFTSPPYADMKSYDIFQGIHPDKYVDWIMPRIKEIERTLKLTGSFVLNINDKVVDKFRHPFVFDLISEIHKVTGLKMADRLFWDKGKYLPHRSRFGDRIEYLFWFVKSKDYFFNIDEMRNPYSEVSINRMKSPIKKRFSRTETNQNETKYKSWAPNPKGALPSTLISIGSESKRVSEKLVAVFPLKLPTYFIKGLTKPGDLVCDIFSGSGTTCLAAKNLDRQFLGFEISQEYALESNGRLGI